jgi:uncharacterized membrane protein
MLLLAATLAITGDGYGAVTQRPVAEIYILILSGVLGIAIADTIFFHALNLCGVGIVSIVDCTYSPFAILFSFLLQEILRDVDLIYQLVILTAGGDAQIHIGARFVNAGDIEKFNIFGFYDEIIRLDIGCEVNFGFEFDHARFYGS